MPKRICVVTTSPMIVNFFLVGHLSNLSARYVVTLLVNTEEAVALKPLPGIEVISMPIVRRISPWHDLVALVRLIGFFRRQRFSLAHSFSPKAGLLTMVAAAIAGVPFRLHTFTGQVWATRRGPMRWLLKLADRTIAHFATGLLIDSPSQRTFLENQRVVPPGKCHVLGKGSVSGVDIDKFYPDVAIRNAVRVELNIPTDAVVALFLGRITRDKGVPELLDAYRRLADRFPSMWLLLVGPDEEHLLAGLRDLDVASCRIRVHGYTHNPERYIMAADVLCLPSHREGFGAVIIEAASTGVPAVASRIYGITDAIVDGETGLLHAPGNSFELEQCLAYLIENDTVRRNLARNARERAVREFSRERVESLLADFYANLLNE